MLESSNVGLLDNETKFAVMSRLQISGLFDRKVLGSVDKV